VGGSLSLVFSVNGHITKYCALVGGKGEHIWAKAWHSRYRMPSDNKNVT